MIALEWMGHVAIPLRWKEFLCHRGCSSEMTSILQVGFIASKKVKKKASDSIRHTKVHYHCKWKPHQDAVYWIHWARAQEKRTEILEDKVLRHHL